MMAHRRQRADMPVHLGSMDRAVETIIRENRGRIHPATSTPSTPSNGGTHLPDITALHARVRRQKESHLVLGRLRGHHADVGGISPGSMSPNATQSSRKASCLIISS
jgi:5-oxoprolinase (ATP-hydrolysing)